MRVDASKCEAVPLLMLITFQPLPMSPKLSAEAIAQLLKQTSAHRVITQGAFLPVIETVQAQLATKDFELVIDDLIQVEQAFPALFSGSSMSEATEDVYPEPVQEPGADDVLMYIHSSGSTGFPTPVKLTGKILLQWATSSVHSLTHM